MGKNAKARLEHKWLKDNHLGMKWQRHFPTEQAWKEAINQAKKNERR